MSRRKKPPRKAECGAPFSAVRHGYEALGAEAFYREHGKAYRNPHEATIRALLRQAAVDWQLDLSRVLDLACGSGEVTLALEDLAGKIDACDPFTGEAYRERTGRQAADWSFEAIADGVLAASSQPVMEASADDRSIDSRTADEPIDGSSFQAERRWSVVVCSFALHLCEPSRLPAVTLALSRATDELLILTPHKRPALSPDWGFRLADERLLDRVRLRRYRTTERA